MFTTNGQKKFGASGSAFIKSFTDRNELPAVAQLVQNGVDDVYQR
jgi:hypothetical protein